MSLRLLLDENCESKWLANCLKQSGHDIACLRDLSEKGISDEEVLALATQHNRVLYTRDRDFVILARHIGTHSGIILEFRSHTPTDFTMHEIVDALKLIEQRYETFDGQIIVINSFRPHGN